MLRKLVLVLVLVLLELVLVLLELVLVLDICILRCGMLRNGPECIRNRYLQCLHNKDEGVNE